MSTPMEETCTACGAEPGQKCVDAFIDGQGNVLRRDRVFMHPARRVSTVLQKKGKR